MTTIKLTQKINVLGQDINTIELREPTTRDVRRLGMPITVATSGAAEINMDVCAKYVVALSNLTDGDIDKMSIDDFMNVAMMVVGFFNPAMPKTPGIA